MKKNMRFFALVFVFAFLFFGCYDAVFQSIRGEVALQSATISGFINNMVRYTNPADNIEYLILSNGKVYHKKAADSVHGAWGAEASLPETVYYDYWNSKFSGIHFYKTASDASYLYALGYEAYYNQEKGRVIPKMLKVYYTDKINGEWKEHTALSTKISEYIATLSETNYMTDAVVHLFCTNTPQKDHRFAYIRIKDVIYKLNGNVITVVPQGIKGASANSRSAVYFNADVHFMDFLAAATNETSTAPAGYVYYSTTANGKTSSNTSASVGTHVFYFPVSDYTSAFDNYWADFTKPIPDKIKKLDASTGSAIISMAVTSDYILVGTDGSGAYRIHHNAGVPDWTSAKNNFNSNAKSILVSPYRIRLLFSVDPSKTEAKSDIYASMDFRYTVSNVSADQKNRGLWAYYAARSEWNRE